MCWLRKQLSYSFDDFTSDHSDEGAITVVKMTGHQVRQQVRHLDFVFVKFSGEILSFRREAYEK